MPAVIAHLLAFAAFASTSPVVDRVAGLDVTQDRVAAQVADSEDAARAAAVDEALLHRAAAKPPGCCSSTATVPTLAGTPSSHRC